jgi:hypothetical protein
MSEIVAAIAAGDLISCPGRDAAFFSRFVRNRDRHKHKRHCRA